MTVKEILETIASRVGRAGVEMVYGTPYTVESRTVIPVAKVVFGFGGGGDEAAGGTGERPSGGGGGGGAAMPVAVVEITGEGTRVLPILDMTRLRLAGFACLALALWTLGRVLSRRP